MDPRRPQTNLYSLAVLVLGLSIPGCAAPRRQLSLNLELQPPDTKAQDKCELWMTFVVPGKAKPMTAQGATLDSYRGTYPNHETNRWLLSEPTCIKLKAKTDFHLPNQLTLRSKTGGIDPDLCVAQNYATEKTIASCIWNGVYLDRYPFDMVFSSYAPSPDNSPKDASPLNKLLRGIKIYRNGELIYRWRGTADQTGLTSLVIRGAEVRQKLMPYDAPLDLRLLPHTAEVPGDYFDEVVKTQGDLRREEIDRIKDAFKTTVPENLSNELRAFNDDLKALGEQAKALTDPYAPTSTSTSTSTSTWATQWKNFKERGSDNFKKDADALEETFAADLKRLHTQGDEILADLKKSAEDWNAKMELANQDALKLFNDRLLGESWPSYHARKMRESNTLKEKLENIKSDAQAWFWFELRFAGDVVQQIVQRGTAAIQQTLQVADSARSLVKDIREYGRDLKSPERQAEAFKQIAESLAERSIFDLYHENPATVPGELNLPMRYRDPLQVYFLHVWHGIALKVRTPPGLSTTEISAANLVPFIDLIGLRWLRGRNRFAEFRLAAAIGFISDEIFVNNQHDIEKRSLFVGNINVSLATFQIGVGAILPFECEVWRRQKHADFFRVFLGVDLVHLLSGQPFMGFNIPQSND